MINELHQITCRVEAVKASGTIPVRSWHLRNLCAVRHQESVPFINVFR
jgi:hypothetical protein